MHTPFSPDETTSGNAMRTPASPRAAKFEIESRFTISSPLSALNHSASRPEGDVGHSERVDLGGPTMTWRILTLRNASFWPRMGKSGWEGDADRR
ncbi:hypothetical protein TBK1r_25360 [Stieleria magnilauensis]|uniref:Uncharacterized protein n=1 Tax=Stieleria magnilauensis TaxID=2527963 RepID=A0ABX5XNP1_9BACT|nr:hypothetical protein TBK1r_25360 [Planctomycetes bacterium TBK1r]